jgi:hypothetical protein
MRVLRTTSLGLTEDRSTGPKSTYVRRLAAMRVLLTRRGSKAQLPASLSSRVERDRRTKLDITIELNC